LNVNGVTTFNGVGKVFKLADAITNGGSITVTNGTFNSQGFDITIAGSFNANNTNTKTITLTGSDLLIGNSLAVDGTNTTWSTPDLVRFTRAATNPTTTFLNAGVPFKKVEISRAVTAAFSGFTLNETGGNLSIEFLEYVGVANANWLSNVIVMPVNITIDKCAFPEGTELISSANGTQRTITTNTNELSGTGIMVRDIAISGGTMVIAGGVDLGNNTNVAFTNFGAVTSHEITGTTYENVGPGAAIEPSVTVIVLKEDDGGTYKEVSRTVSDGTTGVYTAGSNNTDPCLILGIKAGESRGDGFLGIVPVPA
jgi:hypothetical protein